jgi:hypothetical protein
MGEDAIAQLEARATDAERRLTAVEGRAGPGAHTPTPGSLVAHTLRRDWDVSRLPQAFDAVSHLACFDPMQLLTASSTTNKGSSKDAFRKELQDLRNVLVKAKEEVDLIIQERDQVRTLVRNLGLDAGLAARTCRREHSATGVAGADMVIKLQGTSYNAYEITSRVAGQQASSQARVPMRAPEKVPARTG